MAQSHAIHIEYLNRFSNLVDDVITPTLAPIVDQLIQRGHKAVVNRVPEGKDDRGEHQPSSVKIDLRVKGQREDLRKSEYPFISFYAGQQEGEVSIKTNSNYDGSSNTYKLESVTSEIVRTEVFKFLNHVLRR